MDKIQWLVGLIFACIVALFVAGVVSQPERFFKAVVALALENLNPAFWIIVAFCGLRALWLAIEGDRGELNYFLFFNLRAIWWTLATILIVFIRITYKLS